MLMKVHSVHPKTFPNMTDGLFLNALPVLCWRQFFFLSVSVEDFHYFPSPKASQDGPQDGPKLDLVLGGVLGVQNEAKMAQVGPKMAPR